MYNKILKELKKGNAVLVYVKKAGDHEEFDRYRLITPKKCEFTYATDDTRFSKSCFAEKRFKNPEELIETMQDFDYGKNLRITKLKVL